MKNARNDIINIILAGAIGLAVLLAVFGGISVFVDVAASALDAALNEVIAAI